MELSHEAQIEQAYTQFWDRFNALPDEDWQALDDLDVRIQQNQEPWGTWHSNEQGEDGVSIFPYVEQGELLNEFVDTISEKGLVVPFNHVQWEAGVEWRAREDEAKYDEIDTEMALKLITATMRSNRFVEGALVSSFESGDLPKIFSKLISLNIPPPPATVLQNIDVAREVAWAYKPFLDIIDVAKAVGKPVIAEKVQAIGDREAHLAQLTAEAHGRLEEQYKEQRAFSNFMDEHHGEDILVAVDFKLVRPKDGIEAWERLRAEVTEGNGLPVQFVEYHPGKIALVGNVLAAANATKDPVFAEILHESAISIQEAKDQDAQEL